MEQEKEKPELKSKIEADYTGHSEKQLDLVVDNPMKKSQAPSSGQGKQDPGGKGQAVYQSNTKTIFAKQKKQDEN